jgi:hypothetical protein
MALVPIRGGRSAIPIAVLRPADLDRAEAMLDVRAGAQSKADTAWCGVRARNALWVGPASAEGEVAAIARGNGTSLGPLLPTAEAVRWLPEGGLVRGWVQPKAARDFLRGLPERSLPAAAEWITAVAAAELDAARWIAFRRDLQGQRLFTDGFVAYDPTRLPAPVARVLAPDAPPAPPIPSKIPEDVVFAAAFRTEADACLPWLRFLAQADSRGPFRNLEFWIEEFQEHNGLSLEHDLFGSLGENGWELLLESREGESVQWAAVLETSDPGRIDAALLALRDWLVNHAWTRTLGLVRLRPDDYIHAGRIVHGTRIETLLGKLPGPAFAATGDHIVFGFGDRAVATVLDLADTGGFSVSPATHSGLPAHASLLVRGASLARNLARLVKMDSTPFEAIKDLLSNIHEASVQVRYETDGIRVHGEVDLAR